MVDYFVTEDASDLSPSWDNTTIFDNEIRDTNPIDQVSITIDLAASALGSGSVISQAGVPNSDDWEDGGTWTIETIIIGGGNPNNNLRMRVRAVRLTSSGGIDQSGSFTSFQTFTGGIHNFSPVAPTWSTSEACSHRFAIEFEFENIDTMMSQDSDLVIQRAIDVLDLTNDITIDTAGCTGGVTFVPKCVMFK